MIDSPFRIKADKKPNLRKLSTDDTDGLDRGRAEAEAAKNLKRLSALQDVLYAEGKQALLVVLQAIDAGGKDGTISHIFSGVNPQGCTVSSFKVPTSIEKAHDFLWRYHAAVPARGVIGIFNRSHYESVLVERVHDLTPKSVWKKRYDYINRFEEMLTDEGTTVVKFFLHISKEEQAERMRARLDDPKKNWKFNAGDLEERKHWDAYTDAFEDALRKCSTDYAPWYAVPSDRKWFRNWAISDILVRTLEAMNPKYPDPIPDIDKYKNAV